MSSSINHLKDEVRWRDIYCDLASGNIVDVKSERNFLVCNSCLWCASMLYMDNIIRSCPICNDDRLEHMPICDNESFSYDYDPKKGIVFHFSKSNKRGVK